MRHTRARAQGIAEYALILLFIVMAVVAAIILFGQTLSDAFGRITQCFLPGATGCTN